MTAIANGPAFARLIADAVKIAKPADTKTTAAPRANIAVEIAVNFAGLALIEFNIIAMPAPSAATAAIIPNKTAIAAGPAFATEMAEYANNANPALIAKTATPISANDFAAASICLEFVFAALPAAFSPAAMPRSLPAIFPTPPVVNFKIAPENVPTNGATVLIILKP